MTLQAAITLPTNLMDWTTVVANVVTVCGFLAGAIGAIYASKRFFRQQQYEKLSILYCLANDLFRAGLSIQYHRKHAGGFTEDDKHRLINARNALKNWFYDHRFLFDREPEIGQAMRAVDNEAEEIIEQGTMDDLVTLKRVLETRLCKAP